MRRLSSLVATSVVALFVLVAVAGPNVATAEVDPKIAPDARLKPGDTWSHTSTNPMVGSGELIYNPSQCRTQPVYMQTCDVYRVVLDRDTSPSALNFLIFSLEFEQVQGPPVAVAVTALNAPPINDLNIYVWDEPGHFLGEDDATDPTDEDPGGNTFSAPELGGFTADKKAYDITVQAMTGLNNGYTLRLTFSNEKFANPFEAIEKLTGVPTNETPPAPDFNPGSDYPTELQDQLDALTPLPAITPAADAGIANIPTSITDLSQLPFDLDPARAQRVNALGSAPSGATLAFTMVVAPLVLASGAVLWLRRRRQALI